MDNNGNGGAARSGQLMAATARLPAVRREGAVAIAMAVGALALDAVAMGALAIGQLAPGQAKVGRRREQEDDLVTARLTIRALTMVRVPSPAYRMGASAPRSLGN